MTFVPKCVAHWRRDVHIISSMWAAINESITLVNPARLTVVGLCMCVCPGRSSATRQTNGLRLLAPD